MNNPFERFSKSPQDKKPSAPPDVLSVAEQKKIEEFRKLNPLAGARGDGIDINNFRAPQYAERAGMQKDMDALVPQQEDASIERKEETDALASSLPEGTQAEWKKKLSELIEQLTEKPKEAIPEKEDTREVA